jgi:hypothetical protein
MRPPLGAWLPHRLERDEHSHRIGPSSHVGVLRKERSVNRIRSSAAFWILEN